MLIELFDMSEGIIPLTSSFLIKTGRVYSGMSVIRNHTDLFQMAGFAPESLAGFSPESVAGFAPESVAGFAPEYSPNHRYEENLKFAA